MKNIPKNKIVEDWLEEHGDPEIDKKVEKQLELEEAAEKYATNHGMMLYVFPEKRDSFIAGANWQAERMYSEEDMNRYAEYCTGHVLKSKIGHPYLSVTEWFEQFKKK